MLRKGGGTNGSSPGQRLLTETIVTCNGRFMYMPLDRRAELLGRITAALLEEGAADMSLRPLADRVGTSARLLIYHFGSKENLLAAAMAEIRSHIAASLAARAADVRPTSLRALMLMVWNWAVEETNQRYFRLLFEADGLAMFDRSSFSQDVGKSNSAVWVELINKGAARLSEGGGLFSAHATLIMGAFTGLLQEFLTTGDRESTTAALNTLVDLISATAHSPSSDQGPKS
jgi:AcrR family transcriptional regulator